MLQRLRPLIARYQELSPRERVMLALASVAVGYFAIDMLLVTPQIEQHKKLEAKVRAQQVERAALLTLINTRTSSARNALPEAYGERDALQATVDEGERLVNAARNNTDVAPLLRHMVQATPGLRLAALRTTATAPLYQAAAPARPASAASAATPAVELPPLHVKAVEATVQGNYLDLLAYLRRLREHPQPLFWDTATITVGTYPDATLRLVLNVLTTHPDAPGAASR